MRRVVEEALEAVTKDLLDRDYYERRGEEAKGYRNGSREGRLRTSEGEVSYAIPQVRNTSSQPIAGVLVSRHRGHVPRRLWPQPALA